ncbi:amino acid adenylation domain-containing protein, partial [candidate division KSB1 bacterium]|nr:amino acid adenylation domain-containing protein [candidate division KSB1 bacterium]
MNQDKSKRFAELTPQQRRHLEKKALQRRLQQTQQNAIPQRSQPDRAPVSMAQKRLFILYHLQPDTPVYHLPTRLEIDGHFHVHVFQKSIDTLVARHEILRTTFHRTDESIFQTIHSDYKVPVKVVDLTHTRDANATHVDHAKAMTAKPFQLDRGPLLRIVLYRFSPDHAILLFVFHHIICDGLSMNILVRELMSCYTAYCDQKPPRLPALEVQYGDFAEWQLKQFTQPAFNEQKQFWLQKLAHIPDTLSLPTDFDYPSEQQFKAQVTHIQLDHDLVNRLEHLAKNNNASLFMVLLSAFACLVHRVTYQDEFILGTPVGSRPHADLEPLMGFFVNTLALVMQVQSDLSAREWLARVRQECLLAFKNQQVPFDWLVEHMKPSRLPNRPPLVQVLFVMQNMRIQSPEIPDAQITPLKDLDRVCGYEWITVCKKNENGLVVEFEYPISLFTETTMQTWLAAYRNILLQMARNPEMSLQDIEVLDQSLIDRHVHALPAVDDDELHTIPQIIPYSDRPAIKDKTLQLTFKQLHHQSDLLAHALLSAIDPEPEMRIAVLMPKCPQVVLSAVAIFKSRGVYVPIPDDYPKERIAFMLQDSRCRAILTLKSLEQDCTSYSMPVIAVDALKGSEPVQNPVSPEVTPHHLAYIIYTSGTTGRPKGVEVEHGGFTTMIKDSIARLGITADDRVLWFFSPAFDGSLFEIFTTLSCGATLVIPEPSELLDPDLFANLLHRERISVAALPPSFIQSVGFEMLKSIRLLLTAGERAIPLTDPKRPTKSYWNLYGPTEASVTVTAREIRYSDTDKTGTRLGYPLPHTGLSILYANSDRLQPVNAVGEICVSGIQVARGYHDQPELTRRVFGPHPYRPELLMYRTGDLGRMLHDGSIEFLGRKDDQLKIRGYRIEPREIEQVILKQPHISQAAVVLHKISQSLVAFVVGTDIDVANLERYLHTSLPHYMLPSHVERLDHMPKTANGKIDTALLEKWPIKTRQQDRIAPRNERERMIGSVWSEILNHDAFGIHESFFDLGGDSIKAIQMLAQIRRQGFSLRAQDIYRYPTIAQLVEHLGETGQTDKSLTEPNILFPLTPVQAWFFEFVVNERDQFLQKISLTSIQRIDPDALRAALEQLAGRYDSLRLRFEPQKGMQTYSPDPLFPLEIIDATSGSIDMQATEYELQSRIRLDEDTPLLMAVVYRLESNDLVRLIFHHLIIDAVSMRFVIQDLNELYSATITKTKVTLPPATASYQAWARALHDYAQTKTLQNQIGYWRSIESAMQRVLPVKQDAVDNIHRGSQTLGYTLDKHPGQKLFLLPGRVLTRILVAAMGWALSGWIGWDQFVVNLVNHGREMSEIDLDVSRTTGWFTCFYPFVFDRQDSLTDTLKTVSERLDTVPQNGIGYGLLKYILKTLRGGQAELSLNYLGKVATAFRGETPALSPLFLPEQQLYGPNQQRNAELELACVFVDHTLTLYAIFYPQRLDAQEVQAFLENWSTALAVLSEDLRFDHPRM